MKVLALEQGSLDWELFRRTVVTASDIATLMCGSDKEVYDLYQEKVHGKKRYVTDAMATGTFMEEEAREWLFGKRKKVERPCVMNEKCEWLMASLDALHYPTNTIAEFKCPSMVPDEIEKYHRYERALWQIQAQLYCSGFEECWLVLYSPLIQKKTLIKRDEAKIASLLERGKEFYEQIIHRREPALPKGPVDLSDNEELQGLSQVLRDKLEAYKSLDEEIKGLKEKAIAKANGISYDCCGMSVRLVEPEERVDYKAATENLLKGVDLTPFQKRSKPYWRVSA